MAVVAVFECEATAMLLHDVPCENEADAVTLTEEMLERAEQTQHEASMVLATVGLNQRVRRLVDNYREIRRAGESPHNLAPDMRKRALQYVHDEHPMLLEDLCKAVGLEPETVPKPDKVTLVQHERRKMKRATEAAKAKALEVADGSPKGRGRA